MESIEEVYKMIFKKGDKVICKIEEYPAFRWGPGEIVDFDGHEDSPNRVNPGIMIFFDNGESGLLFEYEIEHVCR